MQNTHEVAQSVSPDSRVVYVDNDPMVLAHARAMLAGTTAEGVTTYVHADYHDPQTILTEAAKTLDLGEPVAIMFMGVMGYEPDLTRVRAIVDLMVSRAAPGSYLVFWDGTDTTPAVVEGAERLAQSGGVPYILRSPADIESVCEGLEIIEPGVVPITRWRPEDEIPETIEAYGAVGRKS